MGSGSLGNKSGFMLPGAESPALPSTRSKAPTGIIPLSTKRQNHRTRSGGLNVKIDKDRFTPPAEVKALLAKAK
jgi:hypothetical protein